MELGVTITAQSFKEKNPNYNREYLKKYYEINKKEMNANRRKRWHEYRCREPEQYLLAKTRRDAKQRKLEFNIEKKDIKIPEFCPVFGFKLEFKLGESYCAPSIDRIDSTKGYIKENIHVISWRANDLKADGTFEELVKLGKFAEGFL